MKPRNTWRSRYPGFGWSMGPDRTTRTITAVAAAGLVGTIVGGFSAFGVFSALTPPSRQDAAVAPALPARTVYGTVPDPSAGMTAGAPVQTGQNTAPPQPQQKATVQQQPAPAPAQPGTAPQAAPLPVQATVTAASPSRPSSQPPSQQPPAAQAQSATAVQPQQKSWPDALSRAQPTAANAQPVSSPATAKQTPVAGTKAEADKREDAATHSEAVNKRAAGGGTYSTKQEQNAKADSKIDSKTEDQDAAVQTTPAIEPHRRSYAKKRVVTTKPQQRTVTVDDDASRRESRPVYDYFWSNAPRQRRQDDADQDDDTRRAKGASLSGMNPPRGVAPAKRAVSGSRYARGSRHVPARVDDERDDQQQDTRRDSYERGGRGGFFFGRGNWHDDDDDD